MKQRWSPSITTSRSDCSVSRCRERCVRRDATNCMKFTQFSFQLLPCPFWQKPAGRVGFPASKFHVRQTSCISTSSTFVGLIFICLNSIFQCQLAQNYHFGLLYPCAKKPCLQILPNPSFEGLFVKSIDPVSSSRILRGSCIQILE